MTITKPALKIPPKWLIFMAYVLSSPKKYRLGIDLPLLIQIIVGILPQNELEAHTEDDLMYLI